MTFYKYKKSDVIEWADEPESEGKILFTFDGGKTVLNFWTDYPDKLTPEQVEIFKQTNPYLAELKN